MHNLADGFVGRRRPQALVAYDIFRAVLARTSYTNTEFRGAAACLRDGAGSCCDYSALFVAVCRAAGIPARMAVGYLADGRDRQHAWAEFLLPGGAWVPVDTSAADGTRDPDECFGRLPADRVAVSKGADVTLAGRGGKRVDILQRGAWWWSGRDAPTAEFSFSATKPA
ncbi:MAG: transglutaminase-like domain-containing protein [Planctomycetota bacterium]